MASPPNNWRQISIGALSPRLTELKKRIWFTLGALLSTAWAPTSRCPASTRQPSRAFSRPGRRHPGHVQHVRRRRLERMAIFALNIMPYISASIIMQLMTRSPTLEQLKKEGEQGRKKINQYTRY
jgi:preprotein translocase subunit SecY